MSRSHLYSPFHVYCYLRKNPHLYDAPLSSDLLLTHEKVEELLEAHLMDTDSLDAKLNYLLVTLQNAEASVSLR